MVLYCGREHPLYGQSEQPVDVQKLGQYKYAGFGFNSPNMHAGQKLNFTLAARVHNEEALKVLLLSGQYLGFLPDHVAADFVESGDLSAVAAANTSYQIMLGAIVRKRPEVGRKTEQFLQCLRNVHAQL